MIVTIGCDRILEDGHIDPSQGIFGVLDEKLNRVKSGEIIPARINTSCKCRNTSRCSIDCVNAVHCVIVLGKVSYRNPGKRM